MALKDNIYKVRTNAKMSQEQFAEIFGISRQAVQKWESGAATPEMDNLIKISKYFDISLDALLLNNDRRIVEEMKYVKKLQYQCSVESYSSNLNFEYEQSMEEGLDIAMYKDVFYAVSRLPMDETKKKLGDVLFEVVLNAKTRHDYEYNEPSDIDGIRSLLKPYNYDKKHPSDLKDKIYGAWLGRICGCMLGKSVEGIRSHEFIPFLKESGNYPMYRYIYRSDITKDVIEKYEFPFAGRSYADEIDGMPSDDDTNYVVLAQEVIEKYGENFTPLDMINSWVALQSKNAYCTAEQIAYCNFARGYVPPQTALFENPCREWIGAQIRGDYFGYINPGNPSKAAEMAFRDASVSHIKNGIYGEMFVSAMIAVASQTDNIKDIIYAGLAEIPYTSRLYKNILDVIECYDDGKDYKECLKLVSERFDEYTSHGWCHTISNAMIVVMSLLYGEGDFSKSICMAVESCYDTDCNGATVGSILGMRGGTKCIDSYWTKPFNDKLNTGIFGMETVKISEKAEMTMKHVK